MRLLHSDEQGGEVIIEEQGGRVYGVHWYKETQLAMLLEQSTGSSLQALTSQRRKLLWTFSVHTIDT